MIRAGYPDCDRLPMDQRWLGKAKSDFSNNNFPFFSYFLLRSSSIQYIVCVFASRPNGEFHLALVCFFLFFIFLE